MAITVGGTSVFIVGGPTGTISPWGSDDDGDPFFVAGNDQLQGDTGTFGLGQGAIGDTEITFGETAQILVTPQGPISSVLRGGPVIAWGGQGGASTGANPQPGVGAAGGAGGFGGIDDETVGYLIFGGTDGGKGQNGVHEYQEHKDGIYEGYVLIQIL